MNIRPSLAVTVALGLVLLVASSGAALSFGAFGTFVKTPTEADFAPVTLDAGLGTTGAVLCIGYIADPADDVDESDYAWFLHIDEDDAVACDNGQEVTVGRSFSITGFGGAAGVGWITSSHTAYIGQDFDDVATQGVLEPLDLADFICSMELDGSPGFTIGDALILNREEFNADPTGADDLTPDDVILNTVATADGTDVAASVGVVSSTTDLWEEAVNAADDPTTRPASDDLSCGGLEVHVLNLGSQTTIDDDDVFYLLPPSVTQGTIGGDAFVTQNMVRLAGPTGYTSGKTVRDGDNDLKALVRGVDATTADAAANCDTSDDCGLAIAWADASSGDPNDDGIWLHFTDFDGDDNEILPTDIVIRKLDAEDDAPATADADLGKFASTAALGAGTDVELTLIAAQKMFYYIDEGAAGFDPNDPIYLKHPKNMGDGTEAGTGLWQADGTCTADAADERCLQEGDIRIRVSGQAKGSIVTDGVGNDFDEFSSLTGFADFQFKILAPKDDQRIALPDVANDWYCDEDDDSAWDPAEAVYLGATNAATSDGIRIWDDGAEVAGMEVTGDTLQADCTAEGGAGDTVRAASVKTWGPDTTILDVGETDGAGTEMAQALYWSADSLLTVGDYRLYHVGVDADVPEGAVGSTDDVFLHGLAQTSGVTIYLSRDALADFPWPQVDDVQIFQSASSGGFGVTLTSGDDEIVPHLIDVPLAPIALRMDPLDSASLLDDAYYLYFGDADCTLSGTPNPAQMFRLTHPSKTGGAFLAASDTSEAGEIIEDCQATAEAEMGYIETGTNGILDADDYFYFETFDLGGGGTDVTMSRADVRLSIVREDSTYQPGTVVIIGDDDYTEFSDDAISGGFFISWFDTDNDGEVKAGDMLWLQDDQKAYPVYADLRIVGSGGGTSGLDGSPGGSPGGNDDDDETDGDTDTDAGTDTDPDADTDTETDTENGDALARIAAANHALADSLTVTRDGEDNVLGWDDQNVGGYQVWRSTSPFSLIATLGGDPTGYRDEGAPAGATYVVTAFLEGDSTAGKFTDIDNETVPGNEDLRGVSAEGNNGGGKERVPALGPLLMVALLGLALLVRRRF